MHSPHRAALWALLLGNFVIGTGVMAPAALIHEIGLAFAIDPATVGTLIAYGGALLCIEAPLLSFATNRLDRRHLAALAGLAPSNVDSGQHAGNRRIRGGRAAIRRVLYMACWSVIRKQADFKARYQRLRQQGKAAKVAITACMRVLLIRLNAMVREQTEWRTS